MLTIVDVSTRLQVSDKTVRRLIGRGALLAHRVGAQWRIAGRDLDAYLARSSEV
jgi:excisionase family DNA binding protein